MTTESFAYDVFLSYSSRDRDVVRPLAEQLKDDGLRVWFDEWEIRPGDNIPHKIEAGLEHSRVLVLCMSAHAFASDWAVLESQTFRFRDPLNLQRRFLPLRLDDAEPNGSLAQFAYVDWRGEPRAAQYAKLIEACQPAEVQPTPAQEAERQRFKEKVISLGRAALVRSVAFSPEGPLALWGSHDHTVRLREWPGGRCLRVLEGHSASVLSVAWSADGRQVLSGSADQTVRLWKVASGRCERVLEGHAAPVLSVAWSADGRQALSGSADKTVRRWEAASGRCERVLDGHTDWVRSVAWSADDRRALSGSDDRTVRLWKVASGRCERVFEGHTDSVRSVAWSVDGRRALSGSADKTVRLWEVASGRCLRVLEGHDAPVLSVAWSADGQRALSGSDDRTVRLWEVASGRCLRVLEGHAAPVLSVAWSADGSYAFSGAADLSVRAWDADSGRCLRVQAHVDRVWSVAWSEDRRHALSGAADRTLLLWHVESGEGLRVLEGHSDAVTCVGWHRDRDRAISGSKDRSLRLWDPAGNCERVFTGHMGSVNCLEGSSDGRRVLSGSDDTTIRLWELDSGRCLRVFQGHTDPVNCLAWSKDGRRALSGSDDQTVRLWRLKSGRCEDVFEGHRGSVRSVAWGSRGRALSSSDDRTIRLWEVGSRRCLRVFEGHTASVRSVAWSVGGRYALSASSDCTIRVWDVESGRCLRVLEGHSAPVISVAWGRNRQTVFSVAQDATIRVWNLRNLDTESHDTAATSKWTASAPEQLQYTNAKVLLVGESGVGKTGLALRLAHRSWKETDSTVGAWATQWRLPLTSEGMVEREIWLWDFGGQADQRLIHQLYMDETALAVLVFDGQKEDLFETLGQWDRDLTRASRKPFTKLLAAGRVDAGGLRASRSQVQAFAEERGFAGFLETSAKADTGCEELKGAILSGIRWEDIPWRSSPRLFKRLKDEILRLRDAGRALMRFKELRDALRLNMADGDSRGTGSAERQGQPGKADARFTDEELQAVLGLLAGPGAVWELKFGSWVLLQPERINAYAQAVIQTLREDELERGCLAEERVLNGRLTYQSSMARLEADEERFVLLAMHQTLVERGLCLREQTEKGVMLIFPSYYRRERPDLVGHPAVLVSYRFNGFLDEIYATLVVRLHHAASFEQDQLWRYAADFQTLTGKQLGVKLTRRAEGAGELEVYFDPAIPVEEKIIFSRYVHEHLLQKAQDVARLRHYVCPHCGTPVENREVAMKRLADGKPDILCVACEGRVPLWDELEQLFASAEIQQWVRELQEQSQTVLDNESWERALVGDVISTVALAGQISREFAVSDHGIDMEIEFTSDAGEPTGRKLYLVLESGDSRLRQRLRERERDETEVLPIKDESHARYWMSQAFPVLLVIRTSGGEVRWMEVRDWLKRESEKAGKPVTQIVFAGERFDVMSVRRWRDRVLGGG